MVLVEFWKTLAERDPPLSVFQNIDPVLRVYTLDLAIAEKKTWEVIGHVPIMGEVVPPVLWIKSALNNKLYLLDDPVHQEKRRPTTWEEIRRLGAQPGGVYANVAAENELRRALRNAGFSLAR